MMLPETLLVNETGIEKESHSPTRIRLPLSSSVSAQESCKIMNTKDDNEHS